MVKEGTPLYRIEKGLFEAAVTSAEAALERSKAAKTLSDIQLKRAQELLDRNSGTVVARDQALAADQQADAQIMADQANLATAKINLGYTSINSPIIGKVGKTNITKGNVVDPNSGVLTVIVSQDPMYVSFPVSQREYLAARERKADVDRIKARDSFFGRDDVWRGRRNQFRGRDGEPVDRHDPGSRDISEQERNTDRRAARAGHSGQRHARREGPGAASRADRRSGRGLCVCGRGRQGRRQAPQDRR